MDFTKAGLIDAVKRSINVALYIIASMAVVGLGMYVSDQSITWVAVKGAMLVSGANILIVFLQKWLSTKNK